MVNIKKSSWLFVKMKIEEVFMIIYLHGKCLAETRVLTSLTHTFLPMIKDCKKYQSLKVFFIYFKTYWVPQNLLQICTASA